MNVASTRCGTAWVASVRRRGMTKCVSGICILIGARSAGSRSQSESECRAWTSFGYPRSDAASHGFDALGSLTCRMTVPVTVITDSAASLPAELASAYGIVVVPMRLVLGDDDVPDGELPLADVVARLDRGVTTSAPAP